MSKFEKIKSKILLTPTVNDITPKELQAFLKAYGFILKRSNGSHFLYCFSKNSNELMLNIPMHSPVKECYIDRLRELIIEIEGGENEYV